MATTSIQRAQGATTSGRLNGSATVISTGSKLSLSPAFAMESGRIALYDLQGHLVVGSIEVRNGVVVAPNAIAIPRGVFIARTEK
jgi:hypothetical protein